MMVLVSHSHRFIYLKTFKTGSTSTEAALEHYCLPPGTPSGALAQAETVSDAGIVGHRGPRTGLTAKPLWHGHKPAAEVRAALTADQWDSYFKFTTLRNPYERLVSNFAMRNPEHFVDRNPQDARIAAFEDWLKTSHQATQDLDIYGIDGTPVIDDAIQFEAMDNDRARICTRLGLSAQWPHLRHNPERWDKVGDWRALYTDTAKARVAALYHWEIDRFGYSFDAPSTLNTTHPTQGIQHGRSY